MKKRFSDLISDPRIRFCLLMAMQLGMLAAVMLLRTASLLFQTTGVFYWKVFYQRGLPLVAAGIVFCLAFSMLLLYNSRAHLKDQLREDRGKLILTGILVLIGIVMGLIISRTRLGLEQENAFYGKPTVPLLEWHILLAFTVCMAWLCITRFSARELPERVLRLLPILIWLCAAVVWTAIPNQNGFFSPPGRAPNFETYPFSDGSFYGHYARAAAAGMGLKGNDIPPRPLYIAFLTGLHLISDNQYDRIIFFQTLVIALLPVFVFLCGRDLHSIEGGLAAACLVILRETHAIISAPFGHNISTTKYFFADLPAALVCAAYIWLLIRWQKQGNIPRHAARTALAAGCAMGAMALIRTQSLCLLLLLPFPLVSSLRHSRRQALKQTALFALALMICVMPWLLRSRRITGQFVFDHPMTQTAEMARSYNFDGEDLSQRPDENAGDYTQRLTAFIASAAHRHFPEIARFVTIHFLNSEICGFRLFPLRDHLAEPGDLLISREAFWEELDSADLNGYNLIFYGLGFLICAAGAAASRQRSHQAGLIPLAAILIFNFSTALGRYSAGRYLIPTDWIMMLYFAVGMADIPGSLFRACGGNAPAGESFRAGSPGLAGTVFCLLAVAAAIPACDRLIPKTFIQDDPQTVEAKTGTLQMDCPEEDRYYLHALAVYPRYYAAGEGEPESAKQGYGVTDHGRLVFLTLAEPQYFGTVEIPLDEAPEYLPDGSEVWFSACQSGATSIAETLLVPYKDTVLRYSAGQQ